MPLNVFLMTWIFLRMQTNKIVSQTEKVAQQRQHNAMQTNCSSVDYIYMIDCWQNKLI